MRLLQLSGVTLFVLLNIGKSHSHSGGLNASGCHGGSQPYHCHRSPSEIRISSSGGTRLRCDLGSRSEDCDNDRDPTNRNEEKQTAIGSKYLLEPGFSQNTLKLQILLIRHCDFLPIDLANGVMNNATKDALHVFQRSHGINIGSESAMSRTLRLLRFSPSGNCKISVSRRLPEETSENQKIRTALPRIQTRKSDPEIRSIQEKLNLLGFNAGTNDGYMGPNTRAALKNFQSAVGLERTGNVSDALRSSIDAATKATTLSSQKHKQKEQKNRSQDQNNLTERTQFYLGVLDIYEGPRDGRMNERLEQAILRFQVANQISADGIVTAALLAKIKSKL